MARDYNGDDSDTSMIRESYFKPAPNTTSTPKCNNKYIKSICKKLKFMCINYDSLRSVDKRAELNCLVNHHNPHIILGQESRLGPDINCDSLRSVDKRAELNCLVNHHNPHIILGQESRLGPDINCDSLRSVEKRAELNCLVNHHNPHIILGQESRLGPDINCDSLRSVDKRAKRDKHCF